MLQAGFSMSRTPSSLLVGDVRVIGWNEEPSRMSCLAQDQAASRPAEDQSALLTRIPAMIEPCWKPEALPSDAAGMSVDVAFELENGRLVFDGPQMTSSSGGRKATAESIFQVERRAIVICSENGYDAAYSGTVEMSFGSEGAIALAE